MDPREPIFVSQPESRLLSLPGELRNRIYRDAFVQKKKVSVTTRQYSDTDGNSYFVVEPIPSLLLACKQTRHELWEIYWTENTFELQEAMLTPRRIKAFAQMLGHCLPKIASLALTHRATLFRSVFRSAEVKPENNKVYQLFTSSPEGPPFAVRSEAVPDGLIGHHEPSSICQCKLRDLVDKYGMRYEMHTIFDMAAAYSRDLVLDRGWDLFRPMHCWTCGKNPIL